jgi:two-component system, OmpR family, response regulator CpxR
METAKVLIIDDEVEFSTTLAERLVLRDYEALAATSLKHVLSLIEEERPNVVLLDLKMPGIDGLELLRDIKKIDPGIQVIVITGRTDPGILNDVLGAGAYDCLTKPADISQLMEKIEEITAASKDRPEESEEPKSEERRRSS